MGNGVPSGSRGRVAATVGLPQTQRAAIPTTPRAGRPSWARRTSRSRLGDGREGRRAHASTVAPSAGTPLDQPSPVGVAEGVGSGTPIDGVVVGRLGQARLGDRADQLRHPIRARLPDRVAHGVRLLRHLGRRQVVVDEIDDLTGLDVVQPLARLGRDVRRVAPPLALGLQIGDLVLADRDRERERRDLLSLVDVGADRRHQHERREDDEPQHDHHEAGEADAAEPRADVDRPPLARRPAGTRRGSRLRLPRLPLSSTSGRRQPLNRGKAARPMNSAASPSSSSMRRS